MPRVLLRAVRKRPGDRPSNRSLPNRQSSLASSWDAGKKVVGRKRHILTDTLGLLLVVGVHPASIQDRDGAEALLREARRSFPFFERIIGDAGYQGRKMETIVARTGMWKLQIVRRCDQHRFVVVPKRWIVERTSLGSAVVVGSPAITSVTLQRQQCSSSP